MNTAIEVPFKILSFYTWGIRSEKWVDNDPKWKDFWNIFSSTYAEILEAKKLRSFTIFINTFGLQVQLLLTLVVSLTTFVHVFFLHVNKRPGYI